VDKIYNDPSYPRSSTPGTLRLYAVTTSTAVKVNSPLRTSTATWSPSCTCQRVGDAMLDHALERAGAKGRVVALADEQFFGRVAQLDGDLAVAQQRAQPLQLNLDDLLQLLPAERVEDHDLVDAVEELRAEVAAQHLAHTRARPPHPPPPRPGCTGCPGCWS
jgi:hypothetical protein